MMSFVLFASSRLRSSAASKLSAIGIAAGVATLMVVMAVMNGFQMSFKEAIIELSSAHLRAAGGDEKALMRWADSQKEVRAIYPIREEKSFIIGERGRESAAVIRAVPSYIMQKDAGFAREIGMVSGKFFDSEGLGKPSAEDGAAGGGGDYPPIVLGSSLSHILGVHTGMTVTLLALSGGNDTALLEAERVFKVAGTFRSGYSAINETFAFVPLEAAQKYLGAGECTMLLKLHHPMRDGVMLQKIKLLGYECQSWREYNSAFFGVLRVEKNMMLALVAFIFVAVSVNIYNAMRREVFTRRDMIAVLAAVGGKIGDIRMVFVMRGFVLGLKGAVAGVALGLCLAINMKTIFMLPGLITQNPMYMLYASIPARVQLGETLFIAFFALAAPLAASWASSTAVLNMMPQETLRYE